MPDRKVITVECQCGAKLARYEKIGAGTLRKMYLAKIRKDFCGIFLTGLKTGDNVECPTCKTRVATIQMIHGQPAAKMNQGAIKKVKT